MFEARGCRVLVSSPQAIVTCHDAARFRQAMTVAGVEIGRRADVAAFEADPFYPCFARCRHCHKLIRLADEPALKSYLQQVGDNPVLQDFAAGQEYAVDLYVGSDGDIPAAVVRQRLLVRQGSLGDGVTVDDPELLELSRKAVAACLGLAGPVCCSWIREAGQPPKMVALTPRLTFGAALSIEAGGDWPLYALAEAAGMDVKDPPTIQTHLMMVYHRANVFTRDEAAAGVQAASPRFLH
jgi:hypothetical protein